MCRWFHWHMHVERYDAPRRRSRWRREGSPRRQEAQKHHNQKEDPWAGNPQALREHHFQRNLINLEWKGMAIRYESYLCSCRKLGRRTCRRRETGNRTTKSTTSSSAVLKLSTSRIGNSRLPGIDSFDLPNGTQQISNEEQHARRIVKALAVQNLLSGKMPRKISVPELIISIFNTRIVNHGTVRWNRWMNGYNDKVVLEGRWR